MERHFIDISEDKELCENFKFLVHLDPVRNYIHDKTIEFPWIYRAQPSVLYLEELNPEARIRDAFMKGEKAAKDTVLFHPYKKLYTSCVLRKFILEDPYDPERAFIKYCREKPLNFVIFNKPGLNSDSLGMELAKYWHCIHINPTITMNKIEPSKLDENIKNRLQKGLTVGINDIMTFVKEVLKSPEIKRQGYVLTGLPLRHHINSDFHINEQLELIFETENRPDIIIYMTCPSNDLRNLNEEGFTQDIHTGYYFNNNHINDGAELEKNNKRELTNLGKFTEKIYDYHLMKEYENFYNIEKNGFLVKIDKLPSYNKDLVEDYINKILLIIDSYILEYDAQCVIKVDGRLPVAKMFDIVKAKLLLLPFTPLCEAKPIFEELIEKEIETKLPDDRSIDSLEEEKPELDLEDEDEEEEEEETETIEGEGEDEEEKVVEEENIKNEGEEEAEGQDNMKKQLQSFNKIVPKEALIRLKDFNKVDPDFKWSESDFQSLCPVEHYRGHICLGIPQYTCTYLGKLYMMSSYEAMKEFIFDPNEYIIPPKPFPTCKIFVTGPPCSGKTTFVKILSKFFNLEVISMKQLIEEIAKKKFYDMQIKELVRRQKRVSKVENFENEIFQRYEVKRGNDIINWIEQQLPFIYQRIQFTSLIEIPTQNELPEEEADKEEIPFEDIEGEEDSVVEEMIVPAGNHFLESVEHLLKPDLKQIIMLQKYAIDLPQKLGYEKVYQNPDVDQKTMLMKKDTFEAANIDLKSLKREFYKRGIDFYLDTEQYIDIFINPIKLLQYLPNQFRQPYYGLLDIDFDDIRVQDPYSDDVGIRTEFGYITVSLEELVDKLENKILDIEAEINLNKKHSAIQIGGWIVDDIPVAKRFWEILVDRYLLPDDIVIRNVQRDSCKKVINSFCDMTRPRDLTSDDKDNLTTEVLNLEHKTQTDDMEEPNTFLEVKNSLVKINSHYKAEYENFEDQTKPIKKTCSFAEQIIITQEVLNQLSKLSEKKGTYIHNYLYSMGDTAKNTAITQCNHIENPFNMESLHLKPFYFNFWDDETFLKELYQNITKNKIITVGKRESLTEKVSEAPGTDKDNTVSLNNTHKTSTKLNSIKKYKKRNSLEPISSHHTISSSSTSTETNTISERTSEPCPKQYLADKTRISLQRKKKIKSLPMSVYDAYIASRHDAARPESLFELHNKVILDIPKPKVKAYNIFSVFYRDINAHLSAEPKEFELKYLTEIRKLLAEDADLNEIATAMSKYIRKKKRTVESVDNIMLRRPNIDIGTIGNIVVSAQPNSELTSVLSDHSLTANLLRQGSHLNLAQLKSESSSLLKRHKDRSESDLSKLSLPMICSTSSHSLEGLVAERSTSSQIYCHKESREDIFKSSSVIINVESLPSLSTDSKKMLKKDSKILHLPKIISKGELVQECSSCYCNDPEIKEEICTCSSSTDSEIGVERKKKRLCIKDESSAVILPPIVENNKKSLSEEIKLQNIRDKLGIKTVEHYEIQSLENLTREATKTFKDAQKEYKKLLTDYNETTNIYETEEGSINYNISSSEKPEAETTTIESNFTSEDQEINENEYHSNEDTDYSYSEKKSKKYSEYDKLNKVGEQEETEEEIEDEYEDEYLIEKDSSVDVLYDAKDDSTVSTIHASSSTDLVEFHERSSNLLLKTTESYIKFQSDDSFLPLMNTTHYDSNVLLPGVTGMEWERFINFIDSLYLSVSTLTELGFNEPSQASFYLECCPSRSETKLEDYRRRDSVAIKKSINKWNKAIKMQALDFFTQTHSQKLDSNDDKQECEENLCVLEVALPMSESRFNTALDTALRCLTLGKTISEVFSANKHDVDSRKRFADTSLQSMIGEDDTTKIIKESETLSSVGKDSVEILIDDPSLDAIFGTDKKYEFIELFEGNALRYNSLDERYTPSLEMLSDMKTSTDEESETEENDGSCSDIFLSTVPRAILYVPYVVPRFEPVTNRIKLRPKHLRRYYSLQTMCRLVCTESSEDATADRKDEIKDTDNGLKFKYILTKPYPKDYKSIYIHRPKSSEEEFENEIETETEEMDEAELKEFKEIIEPIIDAVHEEMIKVELEERRKTKKADAIDNIYTKSTAGKQQIDNLKKNTQQNIQHEMKHTEETEYDLDEIEEEIQKKLTFSFPYDIIKLMFQKYDYITMELPYDDIDETLQNELNNMKTPKSFRNFLKAMNYNIKMWINDWDIFNSDMLNDIKCNIINLDFISFNADLIGYLANGVSSLLNNYGPLAEKLEADKEKLIKTINLEISEINEDELERLTETDVESTTKTDTERDIGDIELCELLPTNYTEFYPYCPILYNKSKELIPTNNLYKAEYRDKIYQFSSEDALNEFIKWPERYAVIRNSEYNRTPLRICIVAPRDFEGIHIGRSIADFFGLPLKLFSTEIKRIYGNTLNLPVGVFDEDQINIKMFGFDETKDSPREDVLENSEWDHLRNYFNLTLPLTENELDSLTGSLWKADHGFVFYSFPHAFEDFEYMVRNNNVPDVVIFIDVNSQRLMRQYEIEERIKTRQLLNFGARLKRLLTADHLRYKLWMEAYPKQFNIILRKFLRERRAERNFKERLNLVLPTIIFPPPRSEGPEETTEAEEDVRPWDVEWLLYQVGEQKELRDETDDTITIKKMKRYMNVLDNPKISPEQRKAFLEAVQSQQMTVEVVKPISENEILIEEGDAEGESTEEEGTKKEIKVNLSEILFPNIKSIFESSLTDISEESFQETEDENDKSNLISLSEEKMIEGIKLVNRRQVAVTDFFNPPFEKKYLPKSSPIIYKSLRPFNIEDYKKNVTDASSTSLLGHDDTDSIELRELTSSLSLLDAESSNRQTRLMQLIFGNKVAPKGYFNDIIKQFKETCPPPASNIRKLQKISIKNSKAKLKEYYTNEKEHIGKMKNLCQIQNIPYFIHKSNAPIKNVLQGIKNLVRKPDSFENVFILNNKTATKLLENGFYFLSRFGHWCPVQTYDHQYPMQRHYSSTAEEKIIVPVVHKRYIYFINGRESVIKFTQNPLKYTEQDTMLSIFPVKIAIIGQHKSRKTLIAKNIAKLHFLKYITVELAIKYVLEKLYWSSLAKTMLNNLKAGSTVTHTEIIESIESFINSSSQALTNGWILDGYPLSSKDLEPMRHCSIIPNVIFSIEPSEGYIQETFWDLEKNRSQIQENIYKENEYIDIDYDEEEDKYYQPESTNVDSSHENYENTEITENDNVRPEDENPDKNIMEYEYGEEEEFTNDYINSQFLEEPPEREYIKKIKEMMSIKQSTSLVDIIQPRDFDDKMIEFELEHMLPPACTVEMKMLIWLKKVKKYDKILKVAGDTWGNIYKLEWKEDNTKLMEALDNVLMTYVWALQDYNLNIAKGRPTSLYLIGITENEYQSHKSPFNDCCPACWYYYRIYFRCPTCLFKDMKPGLIQYQNFFYWLCLQHYDMFLSNPIKFLMSYETAFRKQYPEKVSVGELYMKDSLNIQYNGLCITCYYNSLPELLYVKGSGKYSVIINTKDVYLFCSDKCACEMLMRPERYLNLEIEYKDAKLLPHLQKLQDELPCKGFLDHLMNEAIYDAVRKFIYLRPKIFKLSLKTSACTYLAVNLKLKAKHISKRERSYYRKILLYLEEHCKEVEMFCKNIDQIFAFMGPLSIIEQTKAKCLPRDAQDSLLENLLAEHSYSTH